MEPTPASLSLIALAPGPSLSPIFLDVEKKIQKAVPRRTIDYCGQYVKWIQARLGSPFLADQAGSMVPRLVDSLDLLPPAAYLHQPASNLASKIVHSTWSKARSAVYAITWTPGGDWSDACRGLFSCMQMVSL